MLRRLLGVVVLVLAVTFGAAWLAAFVPALPAYAFPLAAGLLLLLRRGRHTNRNREFSDNG